MFRWIRTSQIWQTYKLSVLLADIRNKASVAVQAGCFVYLVREYCVELSVVRFYRFLWKCGLERGMVLT